VKLLLKDKTILIVDDDPCSLILLYELLEPSKANLLTAVNGQTTVSVLQENNVDLILLDIKLGDTTGYKLLPEIRKMDSKICVIAQTAFAYKEDAMQCIEAGFNDYLSKPINSSDLFSMLEKYLLPASSKN
jgi:CheY-like chemotaxis protein